MNAPSLFDTTMARLSYGLDGLSQRQDIIANNVANIDTPGYLTHDIPFEQALLGAMDGTSGTATANGLPTNLPDSITRNDMRVRNDGNDVDSDQQMTEMARTSVVYQAATQLISSKFAMLSSAIAPIS